jgi:hypothetical protein
MPPSEYRCNSIGNRSGHLWWRCFKDWIISNISAKWRLISASRLYML